MNKPPYVLGIDIGTSGAKALVVNRVGTIVARGATVLPKPIAQEKKREQNAELWWHAVSAALQPAIADLKAANGDPLAIEAISVDATSGTIVPVDAKLRPLYPGLMYNDGRAIDQAKRLNEIGSQTLSRLGYRFNASFALAKILWLVENEPEMMTNTAWILHQSDFIVNRLIEGDHPISDESNALKTGYDILERCWPDYLGNAGILINQLPRVAPIGATVGTLGKTIAQAFGMSPTCRVVGGMSDGTAACAASGARRVGDMSTTLGSTIVWKAISPKLICDPGGRLYSHRHPSGCFLPGGAGNAGGDGIKSILDTTFDNSSLDLNHMADQCHSSKISSYLTYPLPIVGERYPFVDDAFAPFTTFSGKDPVALYRSCLEGAAFVERWGYEVLSTLGGDCSREVWTTGSGAHVAPWMQIRANVMGQPICLSQTPESGFGSALVAAMNIWYDGDWTTTADAMITEKARFEPDPQAQTRYNEIYEQFRNECARRSSRQS